VCGQCLYTKVVYSGHSGQWGQAGAKSRRSKRRLQPSCEHRQTQNDTARSPARSAAGKICHQNNQWSSWGLGLRLNVGPAEPLDGVDHDTNHYHYSPDHGLGLMGRAAADGPAARHSSPQQLAATWQGAAHSAHSEARAHIRSDAEANHQVPCPPKQSVARNQSRSNPPQKQAQALAERSPASGRRTGVPG